MFYICLLSIPFLHAFGFFNISFPLMIFSISIFFLVLSRNLNLRINFDKKDNLLIFFLLLGIISIDFSRVGFENLGHVYLWILSIGVFYFGTKILIINNSISISKIKKVFFLYCYKKPHLYLFVFFILFGYLILTSAASLIILALLIIIFLARSNFKNFVRSVLAISLFGLIFYNQIAFYIFESIGPKLLLVFIGESVRIELLTNITSIFFNNHFGIGLKYSSSPERNALIFSFLWLLGHHFFLTEYYFPMIWVTIALLDKYQLLLKHK